ncbi:MAG: glycosyltransferase [Deltaproteobacteria bacterium]|nr:glycosyltransferase [Deltaproteobacteria bacterium]
MLISIIIPARNEEMNIVRCMKSIHANTFSSKEYEVIVVDNGSTDRTADLAKSCGGIVYRRPGVTVSALRNYGAKKSRGKVLAFLDADCTVERDWLESASRYFQREDVACFGSPPYIPANPTWVQQTWLLVRNPEEKLRETDWLESMNLFVRKDAFEQVGGFDETLTTCEDVDISYRLSAQGKIISDPDIKAIHHGEARTIREFFRKELWRGKSNYRGALRHGFRFKEVPSLVLPFYFGIFVLLIFILLVIRAETTWLYAMIILWQTPLMISAGLKIRHNSGMRQYPHLLLLYNVYYLARFCAIF